MPPEDFFLVSSTCLYNYLIPLLQSTCGDFHKPCIGKAGLNRNRLRFAFFKQIDLLFGAATAALFTCVKAFAPVDRCVCSFFVSLSLRGLKRSAAAGTLSTPSRRPVSMETLAVMPGFRRRS